MSLQRIAWQVAGVLIVVGLCCIIIRSNLRSRITFYHGESLWRLTYTVDCDVTDANPRVRAALPLDTTHARVERKIVEPEGLKVTYLAPPRNENREMIVTLPDDKGPQRLTFAFDIHLSPRGRWHARELDGRTSAQIRKDTLGSERSIQVDSPDVQAALAEIRADRRPQDLVEHIFNYCQTQLVDGGRDAPRDAAGAIKNQSAAPLGRVRAMVALCRAAQIPARVVTGIELRIGSQVQPHRWVEVYQDGQWRTYDPGKGYSNQAPLPPQFLPIRRDGVEIVRKVSGISQPNPTFSVERRTPAPGTAAGEHRKIWDIVDLSQLPIEMHEVVKLLLLLPFGALLTAIFRTLIGIRTFGTFSPTLLALSFVYSDWFSGIVMLGVVLVLGLITRAGLERLKLLVVPRLGILLTLVVTCLVLGMSVFDHFGGTPSTNAVMLPLVILTMVVERFFMTTEEDGVRMSLQLLGLTGVVGLCVYLLLCWKAIGNWVLVFPETHFLTVAAFVLLGRYSGYRLTELWRFRDLAIAPEPVAAGPRTTPPTADVSPAQGPEKIGISQIEPQDGGSRVKT